MPFEDDATGRKWAKIYVPDFNGPGRAEPANSYLRLGATEPGIPVAGQGIAIEGDPAARTASHDADDNENDESKVASSGDRSKAEAVAAGEDLAALVVDFRDDYRWRGSNDSSPSQSDRDSESARLHTKGGWRDHTDGNRISTTRGDKVEVIGGNYKLLVLGRRPVNQENGSWREHSGGLIRDNDEAPGAITEIRWEELRGGTWMVTEKSTVGDCHSYSLGYTFEQHRGRQDSVFTGDAYSYHGPANKADTAWPTNNEKTVAKDYLGKSVDISHAQKNEYSFASSYSYLGPETPPNWVTPDDPPDWVPRFAHGRQELKMREEIIADSYSKQKGFKTEIHVGNSLQHSRGILNVEQNDFVTEQEINAYGEKTDVEAIGLNIEAKLHVLALEIFLGMRSEFEIGPKFSCRIGPDWDMSFLDKWSRSITGTGFNSLSKIELEAPKIDINGLMVSIGGPPIPDTKPTPPTPKMDAITP